MKIAHATDIHWFCEPGAADLWSFKRSIGMANLYLRGRRHDFPPAVQADLVAHLVALAPDLVIITGDLTATALQSEFALARQALDPVLRALPTFIIPGNHDRYTRGADSSRRMEEHFSPWMHRNGPLARLDVGRTTVLGLDPNHANLLVASGEVPADQLAALEAALGDPALDGRTILLALHYPLLDRRGAIYDGVGHGLRNARALIDLLGRAPRRPAAILHGHEHHGYTVPLTLPDGTSIPIHDCGSSGYADKPEKRRCAAMNVYTIDDASGALSVERFQHGPGGFTPEAGGAYATGR